MIYLSFSVFPTSFNKAYILNGLLVTYNFKITRAFGFASNENHFYTYFDKFIMMSKKVLSVIRFKKVKWTLKSDVLALQNVLY